MGMIVTVTALIVAPLTAIASHTFTDVSDSNTFHEDIDWLAGADITKGCNPPTNDEFCPNDSVTRGQMSAFMRRFAQFIDAEDGTPGQADNADHATTAGTAEAVANGAVGTEQLALDAAGVAVAGAQVRGTTVANSFNRYGGAPTVTNTGAGEYEVAFPGLEGMLGADAIIAVSDADGAPNIVRHFLAGSDDVITVYTYNAAGVLTNTPFNLIVMSTNVTANSADTATEDAG